MTVALASGGVAVDTEVMVEDAYEKHPVSASFVDDGRVDRSKDGHSSPGFQVQPYAIPREQFLSVACEKTID